MGITLKPGPNSQPVTVQMRIWILTRTTVFDLTQQVHFACIFGFVKFMSFDLQENIMHKIRSKLFKHSYKLSL